MRIVFANWSNRKVGGIESYIESIIQHLCNIGHSIAFLYETNTPINRRLILLPNQVLQCSSLDFSNNEIVKLLQDWKPDIIYSHGLNDFGLKERIIKIAPSVFFAHVYYGTCISGSKTCSFPTVNPCNRRFGWKCLLHYYPNRCGGLNPVTMMQLFSIQLKRLKVLRNCQAIVTHSDHMLNEYIQHGFNNVYKIPYYINNPQIESPIKKTVYRENILSNSTWQLLFLGRMDLLKGGHVFLSSLPQIANTLKCKLKVIFIGDGPQRSKWEQQARNIEAQNCNIEIPFTGWLESVDRAHILSTSDLLIMPSLWPEPFGQVGIEAGFYGIPTIAFNNGGISNWLENGINGYLVPVPPTVDRLTDTITKCLSNIEKYTQLRCGAIKQAQKFTPEIHTQALISLFKNVIQDGQ